MIEDRLNLFFPHSIKVDDYVSRVEILLNEYNFIGTNTIAMMNICRDESTNGLKEMIERIFGATFKITGLGGVITCGVTGIKAGLSHAPCDQDREKYLFISYPHIALHPTSEINHGLGIVRRCGQVNTSYACGALIKCLEELQSEGIDNNIKSPGVHEPDDVEYSILKQRLARMIKKKNIDVNSMNLADITKLAEERISEDLEILISKTVDTTKADYAVFTGIQIHTWENPSEYWTNEHILPSLSYIVVDGEKIQLNISDVKKLSFRQLSSLWEI